MHFDQSSHGQKEKIIRRTMSSGMNLVLIASFIAAPASIVLLPTLSFAAPLPFPPTRAPKWMLAIVEHLKTTGELTQTDLDTLILKGGGGHKNHLVSYKTLASIINRINQLAAQEKLSLRLKLDAWAGTKKLVFGDKAAITVAVIKDEALGENNLYYDLGPGIYDIGGPMKDASVP